MDVLDGKSPLDPDHAVYLDQFRSPSGRITALYHSSIAGNPAFAAMVANGVREAPPEVKAYMRARQKPKSVVASSSSYSWDPVTENKATKARKATKTKPRSKVPRKKRKAHKIDFLPCKLPPELSFIRRW